MKEKQNRNKRRFRQRDVLLFCVILIFSFVCFFGLQMMLPQIPAAGYPDKNIVQTLDDGWKCVSPSGGELISDLPVKLAAEPYDTCTVSRVLPGEFPLDAAICFRSYNQSVYVAVDGETVYSYDTKKELPFGEDTPSAWHFVHLDPSACGQIVEITLISPYRYESGYFTDVWFGSSDDLLAKTMNDHIVEYVISLALFFTGALMAAFSLCMRLLRRKDHALLPLGMFVMLAALWLRVECHVPEIFRLNYAAEHWISFAALMLMPLAYILYRKETMLPCFAKYYERLYLLIVFCDLIRLFLQVTSLADLAETQLLTVIPVIPLLVLLLWEMARRYRGDASPAFLVTVLGVVVFILSIAAEMIAHQFYLYREPIHGGSLFSIGLLVYVVCVVLSSALRYFANQRRMAELERSLTDQRLTMMAGQMQPHFLSNTLLSIQELCYTDPEQAADAIVTFSAYLRTNIDFLGLREPIPFEKEYRYIRDYMKIEKMRFGEELSFVTDVETTDFRVPALTVQPLVENAVRHGIRGRSGGGTVWLFVGNDGEAIRLSVCDDGVGFDPAAVKARSLKSAAERLAEIDGELSIRSEVGKGTEITIVLRGNHEDHDR